MDGAELRSAIIDALRRDLCGPIIDESGCYPGSRPRCIEQGVSFPNRNEANGVFWTVERNEVVRFAPTSRYGVGVLYPILNEDVGEALNEELVKEEEIPAEEDVSTPLPDVESVPSNLQLEPEEDTQEGRTDRPTTMAISFVVTPGTRLTIEVIGATYESFPVTVGGISEEWWVRNPLSPTTRTVELSRSTERKFHYSDQIQHGNLQLNIGVIAHASEPESGEEIVTCWVRNTSTVHSLRDATMSCLFQAQLRVRVPTRALHEYRQPFDVLDDSEASLRLLYRHSPVKAIGHGCDARCEDADNGKTSVLTTQSIPVAEIPATSVDVFNIDGSAINVGMRSLAEWSDEAVADVDRLLDGYEAWIEKQRNHAYEVPRPLRAIADEHLTGCQQFLNDARAGWQLAKDIDEVRSCLCWTARAMADQQLAYRAETRRIEIDKTDSIIVYGPNPWDSAEMPAWRPFQLIFLLSHLVAVSDEHYPRRTEVDVVWMPTGGGKTEAYLALAAFTMLWRRASSSDKQVVDGTAVLMRYTLRLLTAQQLQRTASLICALERIRKDNIEVLGTKRFTVGAWLGAATTPNSRADAVRGLNAFLERPGDRPFLLSRCPWCACDMTNQSLFGYRLQPLQNGSGSRVQARCHNPDCHFSNHLGIPVYEVDEDLYQQPPTFLLGTVDKFAMLAWQEHARAFFGITDQGNRVRHAPNLIIQDELHLITGPLGSLVGLYEGAIASLCEYDGGIRPRVVAATATTSNYKQQVQLLFDASSARLIPPPGLTILDSYFSHADEKAPPKAYLGVCAPGLGNFTRTEARVLASLTHIVGALLPDAGEVADYYWSNVVFFGSLRDLGLSKSLVSTDLRGFQYSLVRATGVRSGDKKASGELAAVRYLTDIELTSASSQSASDALARLQRRHGQEDCVDMALATSVIEVGVDVNRLGLLTVVRQPKTTASYIQVTGRVGRNTHEGPGLIVVLLDARRNRDLSHYERFSAYHNRLFANVEPASVTPFTDAAVERGLRGTVAAIVRQIRCDDNAAVNEGDIKIARKVAGYLEDRASALDPMSSLGDEWELAYSELRAAVNAAIKWGNAGPATDEQFLRRPETAVPPDRPSWAVPTSLRNIDNTGGLRVDPSWFPPAVRPSASSDGATINAYDAAPALADSETEW
jgi:hypothetical protein|nr:helicase-related protein [Ferrimicrobium acidiphilum]